MWDKAWLWEYIKFDPYAVIILWRELTIRIKIEALSWGRYFLNLDLKTPFISLVKVMDTVGDSPNFSSHAIWLSIVAIFATGVFMLKYADLRAFIRAKNCKVNIDWHRSCPNRVGGLVQITITLFQAPTAFTSLSFPETETIEGLINNVTIKVFVENEEIVVDKDINNEEQAIIAHFRAIKSGTYYVNVWYKGYRVKDSPFSAIMDALTLDPSKSYIEAKSPVIIVQNEQFKIDVIPNDSYGNRCATTTDDRQRLKFYTKKCEPSTTGLTVPQNDENFNTSSPDFRISFGMRREDAQNPNTLPIYTVYGKCSGIGLYNGSLLFGDSSETPKTIELLSISPEEEANVYIYKKQGRCKLEAIQLYELERLGDGLVEEMENVPEVGLQKIFVELTTRFFCLTKFIYGGPMEDRFSTWRIEEDITLKIVDIVNQPEPDNYVFRISNPTIDQNLFDEFIMNSSDGRILYALFHDLKATRRSTNYSTHIMTFPRPSPCEIQSLEFKQKALYKGILDNLDFEDEEQSKVSYRLLSIRRNAIVETTLEATDNFTILDWAKPFVVSFQNEPMKAGDSWLEWSEILLDLFFESNEHGMFVAQSFSGGVRRRPGLIHPNPNRHHRWTLKHYELAGKIIAKYLLESAKTGGKEFHVDLRFSKTILAKLLSTMPTYKHLEYDDPEMFRASFEPILKQDLGRMKLSFVTSERDNFGQLKIVELIPDGENISVVNENKITYLNALAKFCLISKVEKEIDAFVLGFTFMIPEELLNMFDENELEIMLCGATPLNLQDFHMHLNQSGEWHHSFVRLKDWLWKALQDIDTLDLGRFYQFLSGSSRLPKTGFKELMPTLCMSALYGQLPTANTMCCQLSLTDNENYEEFCKALKTAIRNSSFDIST